MHLAKVGVNEMCREQPGRGQVRRDEWDPEKCSVSTSFAELLFPPSRANSNVFYRPTAVRARCTLYHHRRRS